MLEKSMGGFESLPKSGSQLTRVEVSLQRKTKDNIKSKTGMQLILYCLTYKGLHL